jgi:hypothetical protein
LVVGQYNQSHNHCNHSPWALFRRLGKEEISSPWALCRGLGKVQFNRRSLMPKLATGKSQDSTLNRIEVQKVWYHLLWGIYFEQYYASLLHQDPCADCLARKGIPGQVLHHAMPQKITINHFFESEH